MKESCLGIVEELKNNHINFLALDFDLTLVSIHTNNFEGSIDEIEGKIRPIFQELIPIAVQKGLSVGIVSFCSNHDMIKKLCERWFPHINIPISTGKLTLHGENDGKKRHIAQVAKYLIEEGNSVTKNSTLLIDDSILNIEKALDDGIKAVLYQPSLDESFFLGELHSLCRVIHESKAVANHH